MKQEVENKGIFEDASSQNTRQLRDPCLQHDIPTSRRVENVLEQIWRLCFEAGGYPLRGKQTGQTTKQSLGQLRK
jgi:hypothetical protein